VRERSIGLAGAAFLSGRGTPGSCPHRLGCAAAGAASTARVATSIQSRRRIFKEGGRDRDLGWGQHLRHGPSFPSRWMQEDVKLGREKHGSFCRAARMRPRQPHPFPFPITSDGRLGLLGAWEGCFHLRDNFLPLLSGTEPDMSTGREASWDRARPQRAVRCPPAVVLLLLAGTRWKDPIEKLQHPLSGSSPVSPSLLLVSCPKSRPHGLLSPAVANVLFASFRCVLLHPPVTPYDPAIIGQSLLFACIHTHCIANTRPP
jgi:hypothetical protein